MFSSNCSLLDNRNDKAEEVSEILKVNLRTDSHDKCDWEKVSKWAVCRNSHLFRKCVNCSSDAVLVSILV